MTWALGLLKCNSVQLCALFKIGCSNNEWWGSSFPSPSDICTGFKISHANCVQFGAAQYQADADTAVKVTRLIRRLQHILCWDNLKVLCLLRMGNKICPEENLTVIYKHCIRSWRWSHALLKVPQWHAERQQMSSVGNSNYLMGRF